MSEKEIDLSKPNTPAPVAPEGHEATESSTENMFSRRERKLSQKLGADVSSRQLVDIVVQMSREELLPFEEITLPSLGQYYESKIPGGKIQVRPMGIMEDKAFATARLAQTGQALDRVFKNCIKFPTEFDPLDLINGDRVFLIFILRGITHGNLYEFVVRCPNESCRQESTHTYDMNQLGRTIRHPQYPEEPIKVRLPYMSNYLDREFYVKVRYLRGRDNKTIEEYRRFQSKLVSKRPNYKDVDAKETLIPLDESIEKNLDLVISDINGETDRNKIKAVISKLSSTDTSTIRRFLADTMPGLDTMIEITCPQCETIMNIDLPITESFFRPKDSGGM